MVENADAIERKRVGRATVGEGPQRIERRGVQHRIKLEDLHRDCRTRIRVTVGHTGVGSGSGTLRNGYPGKGGKRSAIYERSTIQRKAASKVNRTVDRVRLCVLHAGKRCY